ncbi:MAG: hypothetical protein DDG60_07155 [Anaerolineae bacterium]|nr:MAG: hypothetical protein DDG60_07155 [Anaerolineae bacterium]
MREQLLHFLQRYWMGLALLMMLPIYWNVAILNEQRVDYINNGFFKFWLAGHMTWTPEHPYSLEDWDAGHQRFGATWMDEKRFAYPLPLALLVAPLGLLPISTAYILWDFLAQILIASCLLWLATRWEGLNRRLYVLFLLAAASLNGNIYLGLMTGTLAALFLLFLTLSLYFMENGRDLLAGFILAFIILKPPLITILALLGLWLLFRRRWRVLAGMVLGGVSLLIIGLIQDPQWLSKFLSTGDSLLGMRLGHQPTILSYTRLACAGNLTCALTWYAVIAFALVGLFTLLLWRIHAHLTPLMAFSLTIPLGLLLPPYIWSYDYTLFIIPIAYIAFELIQRYRTYIFSTLFLLLLTALALVGLTLFWMNPASDALSIQRDMWSIWTALYVLAVSWWVILRTPPALLETPHT